MMRMAEIQSTVDVLGWSGAYLTRIFLQDAKFEVPIWRVLNTCSELFSLPLPLILFFPSCSTALQQHFAVGMAAALSEDATLEELTEGRRKYVQEKYGDIRLKVVDHYQSTWEWIAQKHVCVGPPPPAPSCSLRLVTLTTSSRSCA
jgi:hypothetical protein